MEKMFKNCFRLKEIKGISNLSSSFLSNMNSTFENCEELEYVDLSNLKTSKGIYLDKMFKDCYKLKEIKGLSNFNIQEIESMFENCYELKFIDFSNVNMSEVQSMKKLFKNCQKLKEIKGFDKLEVNKIVDMTSMFENCFELESLDLSNFNTSKVHSMREMFKNCEKLREIKGFNNIIISNPININTEYIFENCLELENIDLSIFKIFDYNTLEVIFYNCKKLKEFEYLKNQNNTKEIADKKKNDKNEKKNCIVF